MSHFTVLVIGENPEDQLAPFHEFECTGIDDQYVQDIDRTAEARKEYDDSKKYEDANKEESFLEFVKDYYGWEPTMNPGISEKHKYGYVLVDEKGNVIKCIDRTNPNKQWDWFVLGGRWTGFFKLKEGVLEIVGEPGLFQREAKEGHGDCALKSEIDFDLMRNEAGLKALQEYELAEQVIGHLPMNRPWKEIGAEKKYSDEAREIYRSQPRVMAWGSAAKNRKDWPFGWRSSCDDFLMSREQYIENARNNACVTHAVIKDGKWYESGSMGWWGMVSNEKDSEQWADEFSKLIDDLPDDTMLSVYDCHI